MIVSSCLAVKIYIEQKIKNENEISLHSRNNVISHECDKTLRVCVCDTVRMIRLFQGQNGLLLYVGFIVQMPTKSSWTMTPLPLHFNVANHG